MRLGSGLKDIGGTQFGSACVKIHTYTHVLIP